MDESWWMQMGLPTKKSNLPRRRSTEETSRRTVFGDSETLDPEDFRDVFGGPPRSVLSSQFSGGGNLTKSTLLYEEVFRLPDVSPAMSGMNLPEFRIPASRGGRRSEKFYGGIFGKDVEDLRRSRSRSKSKTNSKSKSNSSSVLSSEELSPYRQATVTAADVSFSSFASKLRPINVPSKWNSSTMMHEVRATQPGVPDFSRNRPSCIESHFVENECLENLRSSHCGLSRRVPSPEIISMEPNSYGSPKVSVDDVELNSPSSVVSSLCQDQETKASRIQDEVLLEEEDEVMSSYVIEINTDNRERACEVLSVDEAIAWAKEKFQTQSSEKDWSMRPEKVEERPNAQQFQNGQIGERGPCGSMQSPVMEMELLDEDIRLWSVGKEANIQFLLSTLHHVLWQNSGWHPIPLTNLKESSHVKKAYQKARLCLHPDKLQQRGATLPQKYIAEKAFPILQDAWAAFISEDVFFRG